MLTSSDAKFRCLWHMFTWSIMLTLVSQFYVLTDHIAFYMFGSLCIIVLPFVTSVYSTTGGQRGSSLLRVAYVLCDPVLACMSVVPVLLLNRLTPLIHEMECLGVDIESWNETLTCLGNKSSSSLDTLILSGSVPFSRKPWMWLEKKNLLTAIQGSIIIPCILALFMGRRSRKMSYTTALMSFTYWLITSIECASIIETTLLCGYSKVHFAVTTQVTVCVACILANSYAAVTLCSYLSPMTCKGDKSAVKARFDVIYKCIVGATGVIFVEIPQLVARFQMLALASDWPVEEFEIDREAASEHNVNASNRNASSSAPHRPIDVPSKGHVTFDTDDIYNTFPTSFYMWAFKDGMMIVIIIASLVLQKFGQSPPILLRILGEGKNCAGVAFDNPDTFFVPEKRDKYIVTHCGKLQDPDFRDGAPRLPVHNERMLSIDTKDESCFFLPRRGHKPSLMMSMKHKKTKRDAKNQMEVDALKAENDDRAEHIALSPVLLHSEPGDASIDDNVANDSKEKLILSAPRDVVVVEDQTNTNGRRKKSVKFSFSGDHIIGSSEGGGRDYPKIHPRITHHTMSATSILVNSNSKDANHKVPTDAATPLKSDGGMSVPPDVIADDRNRSESVLHGDETATTSFSNVEGTPR